MRPHVLSIVAFIFAFLFVPASSAHRLEPISTEFARPFEPWTGSLQVTYAYDHFNAFGRSVHLIPDAEFELGLSPRTQISVEMPLIRESLGRPPARMGGGNLEFAFRYLIAGGPFNTYAISLNPFVSPPTGDTGLAGDATEAGIGLHADKQFGERAFFHGNYGWSTTIGGSEERERLFFYRSAVVVPFTLRWNPALELLGATDTATRKTRLAIQPEVIYYVSPYWELKLGVPFGLTRATPNVGVRLQISWVFGKGGTH